MIRAQAPRRWHPEPALPPRQPWMVTLEIDTELRPFDMIDEGVFVRVVQYYGSRVEAVEVGPCFAVLVDEERGWWEAQWGETRWTVLHFPLKVVRGMWPVSTWLETLG